MTKGWHKESRRHSLAARGVKTKLVSAKDKFFEKQKDIKFPKSLPLETSEEGTYSYLSHRFNISRAKYLAEMLPVDSMKAKREMIPPLVYVDEKYAMTTNLSKPVIFLELYLPERTWLLIDGNHRVFKAVQEKKNVNYVLIPNKYVPDIHMGESGKKSYRVLMKN